MPLGIVCVYIYTDLFVLYEAGCVTINKCVFVFVLFAFCVRNSKKKPQKLEGGLYNITQPIDQ